MKVSILTVLIFATSGTLALWAVSRKDYPEACGFASCFVCSFGWMATAVELERLQEEKKQTENDEIPPPSQ